MSKNVLKSLKSLHIPHSSSKKEKNNYEVKKQNKKKKILKGIKELLPNMGNIFSQNRPHNVIENMDEYATNLMTALTEFRQDGIRCDVTFNNNESMAAHRVVVSFNQQLLDMAKASSETVALNMEEDAVLPEHSVTPTDLAAMQNVVSGDQTPIPEHNNVIENDEKSAPNTITVDDETTSATGEIEPEKEEKSDEKGNEIEKDIKSFEEESKAEEDTKCTEEMLPTNEEESCEESGLVSELKTGDIPSQITQASELQDESNITSMENIKPNSEEMKNEEVQAKKEETEVENESDIIAPPLSAELSLTSVNSDEDEDDEEGNEDQCANLEPNQPYSLNNPIDVLIHFLYTSHIDITQQNVTPLRVVAVQCGMEDVITACNEFDKVLQMETESMATNEEKDAVASQFRYRYSDPTMPSKMLQHFEKLRNEKKFTDVTVRSSSKSILLDAHSVILASGSNFFRPVISTEQNEVDVTEIDESILEPMINFMYTGKVSVNNQSVSKLIQAADRLQFSDIMEGCAEFLEASIDIQNCIQHRRIGIDYKCHKLKDLSDAFIAEHFISVTLTPDFLTLSVGSLLEITSSNSLCLDFPLSNGEMAVFNAVKRWVLHDEENRKQHLAEVMSAVRFPAISEEHLLNDVTTDLMVMSNQELCDRITSVISSKPKMCFDEPMSMRGSQCIITAGGSYPVADETSEERGYQAVTYSNQMTAFDPKTGTFHELTTLPETRSLHCVVACDQFVFVVGGFDSYSCIVQTVYCFDLSSGKWHMMPKLKIRRACFSLHLLSGYLYAVGGLTPKGYTATVERLDRKKKVWELAKPLPCTRYRHAGCVLNGQILISGGHEKQDSVFTYNPNTDEWKKSHPLNVGRDSHVMQAVDEKAYAIGGDGISFSAEVYSNSTWTMLVNPAFGPKKLYLPGIAVIDDQIYLSGGWSDEDEIVRGVRYYDTKVCDWQSTNHLMTIPRGSSSSCTIRIPKNYWKVRFNTRKFDD